MRIEVKWRAGKQTIISGAKANRVYEVDEEAAIDFTEPVVKLPSPLFHDVIERIKHTHVDEFFDDFALFLAFQRLLLQYSC